MHLDELKGFFFTCFGGFVWLGVPHSERKYVSAGKNFILCSKKMAGGEREKHSRMFHTASAGLWFTPAPFLAAMTQKRGTSGDHPAA